MRTFIFALAALVVAPFAIDQIRAADRLPAFDIDQNCKAEAEGTGVASDSCTRDERDAKGQLAKNWSRFSASQKRACVGESSVGGDQSYVELLTCLEMAGGGHFSTKE